MLAPTLNTFFSRSDHTNLSAGCGNCFSSSEQLAIATSESTVEDSGFDGYRLFDRLLQKGYVQRQAGAGLPLASTGDESSRVEKTAGVILGFIEQRLRLDAAEGASEEELAARLQAGLEGFEKGFSQAREQLEALGLLPDSVAEEVGKTYDRVLEGVEGLREKYLVGENTQVPEASVVENTSEATYLQGVENYGYAARNTFSFELETEQGDKVRIRASAQEVFASQQRFSAYQGGSHTAGAAQYSADYSQSSRFSLQVNGTLNETELTAINDLLAQVNDLSAQFFSGDVEGAFEEALNIGYDDSEIVGFSLKLTRSEVERVASAYQAFTPSEVPAGASLPQRLAPLGQFARGLLQAVETASLFAKPEQLLGDIANGVTEASESPEASFGPFVSRLLDALELRYY
ncbi:MAG: DUF5610 domain-containing protein [Exilibacterium sp.]